MTQLPDYNSILEGMAEAIEKDNPFAPYEANERDLAEAALQAFLKMLPEMTYTLKTVSGNHGHLSIHQIPCEAADNGTELYQQLLDMRKKDV